MINRVYQLIRPRFSQLNMKMCHSMKKILWLFRPNYLALCHADQRYFQGTRPAKILQKKLPMALIHECCGIVVADPTGTYKPGDHVVMIPNQPPRDFDHNTEFYENYVNGTYFRSSGHDGFMREFVTIPINRVVKYEDVPDKVVAISELCQSAFMDFAVLTK